VAAVTVLPPVVTATWSECPCPGASVHTTCVCPAFAIGLAQGTPPIEAAGDAPKLAPLMVIVVPPVVGPFTGETLAIVGRLYENPLKAGLSWPATVMVVAALPAPAGVTQRAEVWLSHVGEPHAALPRVIVTPPAPVPKLAPVSVIVVPPAVEPPAGDTAAIIGG
jgi:hypothetical protein